MKLASLANIAVLLAPVGWCFIAYGVITNMGDPAPWVPIDELRVRRLVGMMAVAAGFIAIIVALWFAGRSFKVARFTASLAFGFCAAPFAVLVAVLAGYLYFV